MCLGRGLICRRLASLQTARATEETGLCLLRSRTTEGGWVGPKSHCGLTPAPRFGWSLEGTGLDVAEDGLFFAAGGDAYG